MEEHDHTVRLTDAGFVVCVCGWATAAVDREPRQAAADHISAASSGAVTPRWVDRPGGTVCIPGSPTGNT